MGKLRALSQEEKLTMRLDDIIYYENLRKNHDSRDDHVMGRNAGTQYQYEHGRRNQGFSKFDDDERMDLDVQQHDNYERKTHDHYSYPLNNQRRRNNNRMIPYYNFRNHNHHDQLKLNYNKRGRSHRSPYWNKRLINKIQSAPSGTVFRRLELDLPSLNIPGAGHIFYDCVFHFHHN